MAIPLINGRAFDFTQIIVNILGVPIVSVTAINYEETQEKVNNFGTGNRPVSRGVGPIDATGSIEFSMNDSEALREVAPEGSLLQIPAFDIIVNFTNLQGPQTHILKNVEFTSDGHSSTQGDTDLKRSFDLVISNVQYR